MNKVYCALLWLIVATPTFSEPLAAPGNLLLRNDLQYLNDSGVTDIPLTAWPVSLGNVHAAFKRIDAHSLTIEQQAALRRTQETLEFELEHDFVRLRLGASAAVEPRVIRTFENTPREEGEVRAGLYWLHDWFTLNLSAAYSANPFDEEEFRPDGSYVGIALGNWIVTAGWQERWWGPGRDGSLILSSNARPTPGVALQRNLSTPFQTKWLRWLGPWTLTAFMTEMDDPRNIEDTRLFGVRGSFRPPGTGLEIGISRVAQWCGEHRPCDLPTFGDLLVGNDNRGVNVNPDEEPGNQLGGFDIRWTLPRRVPVALYMQWIGEDGRGGGGAIGSWLRQAGLEFWGNLGDFSHRTHFEVADTTCQEGGFGFSGKKPNCSYEHSIYTSGYSYYGRSPGHAADGDSLSYSIGSTLVQSAGHSWNLSLRYMEINRDGAPDPRHSLSATPQELTDLQVSHARHTRFGHFHAGFGYSRTDNGPLSGSDSDVSAFLQWSSQ